MRQNHFNIYGQVERWLYHYGDFKREELCVRLSETGLRWVKLIEDALAHFKPSGKDRLLERVYFERLRPDAAQEKLFLEKTTYYVWKKDVLQYLALEAALRGLLDQSCARGKAGEV